MNIHILYNTNEGIKFLLLSQVCQLSIGAACRLSWPLDRMIVQVLDDSTDPASKVLCSIFFPPKIFGLYV